MEPERFRKIDGLLQSARKLSPEECDAFLRHACAGDDLLEHEVRSLLSAEEQAGSFLESPALEVAARSGGLLDESTGTLAAQGPRLGLVGRVVSQYKILDMLGTGGMGVVYKAFDTKLDRLVALKFLSPHVRHNSELKRRLSEEARASSALDHPNIVVIYDIGEGPDGDLFIAMAFHEGTTLQERITAGVPLAEALEITRQIAAGLARAHERGIFHRDIKPNNVIVAKNGIARIIDFGLAKSSDATATLDGSTKGTPLYMSPEQAAGTAVDSRTDLWSLGVVLYQMLAGRPPFSGETHLQVMHAIVHDTPPRLREIRPELPAAVDVVVSRALQKDPAKRYQSATDMERDLSAIIAAGNAPVQDRSGLRMVYAVPALVLVLLLVGLLLWFYQRSEKRHWAREQAIPEIGRLTRESRPVAAFLLARKAQQYLPGDTQLAQLTENLTHLASIRSTPAGATVEIKDYLSPDDSWLALGTTPLNQVPIPKGYLRWRVSKAGGGELFGAPVTEDVHGPIGEYEFHMENLAGAPQGMVPVPGGPYEDLIWSIGPVGPYNLPTYDIDQFEVTNRQFQAFVDQGGYQKHEYWKEKWVRDGKELRWEQAMDLLRDTTGRPGPATWAAGHYPNGQADLPVGGVSWYEASAYAVFAGKSLPVIGQWYRAAPSSIAKHVIQLSNFSGTALAPAGKYKGIGPWGTYDMAGNMAEWCRNQGGGNSRYILGGAWDTSSAEYFEPATLPPFARGANNGLRCVRNREALSVESQAEVLQKIRDLSKTKPASNEIFRIYKATYAYDRTPLNAKLEPVDQDSADWHKEKITFDAAYGKERMAAYLFIPAKVRPPYQTVVYFPSARVLGIPTSATLGDMKFIDYVIQSGRAVLYPVYKGTYERQNQNIVETPAGLRETLIQQSKDLGRSIDYLETRADIDRNKIAYMGVSMGAAWGVIFAALEERFKAVIMLDGGFFEGNQLPGMDQADFAPRLKAPALLITGKFDWVFLGKDALFQMLGAPKTDKRAVSFDTAHDVSEQRADLIREVIAWLDKYFGRVS